MFVESVTDCGGGRVTSVQLDVAALGKGFQRRTGRMEIREEVGVSVWRTIAPTVDAAHEPARLKKALCSTPIIGTSAGWTTL